MGIVYKTKLDHEPVRANTLLCDRATFNILVFLVMLTELNALSSTPSIDLLLLVFRAMDNELLSEAAMEV